VISLSQIIETKKKLGRPCKYETHVQPYLNEILEWLKQGMNEYSIEDKLGISTESWIEYKRKYAELAELFTRATHERVCLVQNKQFAKACGYTVPLKKQKVSKDGEVIDIIEEVHIPPDVNSAEFWSRMNDPNYIPPKSANSLQVINNNFQLEDAERKMLEISKKYNSLETVEVTDFEVIPD
jgi:hypothetical protein